MAQIYTTLFMETITIKDKTFDLFITADTIQEVVNSLAEKISADHAKNKPVFLVILNGAFLFAADLVKKLDIECEISFIKVASYIDMQSTGVVTTLIGLNESISGRDVIIIEDIVDTGTTAVTILDEIKKHHPKKVQIASLLIKPKALTQLIHVDYIGFEIENNFIVGYGLDYDGLGRNLNNIYKLAE